VSMKSCYLLRALLPLGALLSVLVLASPLHASTREHTLEAIHQLENPRNLSRPGARGELGAYQFRASTWRMHTAAPFTQALDRAVSDEVAFRHYEWLRRGLESARLPATPYTIALAWNGGLAAAVAGRSSRAAHDYAQRAANLAADLELRRRSLAESVTPRVAVLP
jgi:hypothetical protein